MTSSSPPSKTMFETDHAEAEHLEEEVNSLQPPANPSRKVSQLSRGLDLLPGETRAPRLAAHGST